MSNQQQRVATALTGDGQDGFPSETEFREQMEDYLGGLNPKKRAKALMSREMYATILSVLLEPHSTAHATAQFRFWAKRMFRLVTTPHANLVAHENRPVAVKDQIYHILVGCHGDTNHSGRDKTSAQVRRYYSWLPKELVSRFVKMCPTCIHKRRQQQPYLSDSFVPPGTFGVPRRIGVVSHTKPLEYADEEGQSPEGYENQPQSYPDSGSGAAGGGNYADFTPVRRGSEESEVYEQQGVYEENRGLESSPTNYVNGSLDYANYYLQAMESANVDFSLPVPPPNQQASIENDQQQQQPEQTFFYQDENGQTYAYDSTGALVPQIVYSGLPLPVEYATYDASTDQNGQPTEIIDYSNWQLPPPEVDNSLEILQQNDYAEPQPQQQQSQSHQQHQQQHETLYDLPPIPASAPAYQLSHFPGSVPEPPRRDSMPTLDQTARNLEYANQQLEEALSEQPEEQPLGLALFTESPSNTRTNASNAPTQSSRRAKPPPLDLGKSSNLFPTTLSPTFRRSATTGVPQYLSANYNLDAPAPLSAPLQRGYQFNTFRDVLPSPGPSSACSTTSTIFSSAGSLPLTPGTSRSTASDAAQSAMGNCSDDDGNWQQESDQLDQAIRLLYDSHIETSGGGGGPIAIHPAHTQSFDDNHHDALLAHFLGTQQTLDDGVFAALTSTSSHRQQQHLSNDVGPEDDQLSLGHSSYYTPERLRRDRMRTRTVSAGPSVMRSGGIGALEYAASKMATGQSAAQSVTRTPTKDLRYMPY
ncbi:integrase zinc binding domain-containing protein [Sporobolomyces salmoneus]|uniref:integrase zinc binding domain-containing protein n=1 Tax=Sporobolomyces salmoneus TaxID=183962 RepID=UPI0031710C66